ncbi:MAG: sigma 54-interacting transcriptional regulator, partial [Gammaproteobacteria bacterium]
RRKRPFLPINCSAISAQLIESEMFGHEKGSFTGATRSHQGYIERADGGTLFLDEVTEMPVELQAKLLRVLETGAVMRVGGEEYLETDVRMIAATNRVPEEAVAEGKLREDLLYRLQVFPLHLPPLRERMEDTELLANYFLAEINRTESTHKTISRDALDEIKGYGWPGNVRELKNSIHRAFIMADDVIDAQFMPQELGSPRINRGSSLNIQVGMNIGEAERRLILATLERCGGNKEKTAQMLGVSSKTLYNRLHKYEAQ